MEEESEKKIVSVNLTKEADANIKELADELGVSFECAANLMITRGLMLYGSFETEEEYLKAIHEIEGRFSVKVEDKMPKFVPGGDEEYSNELAESLSRNKGEENPAKKDLTP